MRWYDADTTPVDRADLYGFFAGHAYTKALQDFALVSGPSDLPPLSALGIWWSRYWVYSVGVPSVAMRFNST